MATSPFRLPSGIWRAGCHVRDVTLRPLGGEDEVYLLELSGEPLPAQRANALVARCLVDEDPVGLVRDLPLGDRDAILLHIRRLNLGERLDAVTTCPVPQCGAALDLELAIGDLLLAPRPVSQPVHECTLVDDGLRYIVALRRATAGDQEELAALARSDPEVAAARLLDRCVREVRRDGTAVPIESLSSSLVGRIDDALRALDPQAEMELDVRCASCETTFAAIFDATAYVLGELRQRGAQLMHEIHTLAVAYHWSEREILMLPPARRRGYLDLVAAGAGAAR